jgi:cell division protein FtsN
MTPTVVEDHGSTDIDVSQKNSETDGVLISTTNYYIIVGCYKTKKVLENEKNRFTKMGYSCQVLPKSKNGLMKLSVASFDNKADADAWLRVNKNIKALKGAWILKVDEDTVK